MVTILFSVLGIAYLGGAVLIAANLRNIPEGFQDEHGFHYTRKAPSHPRTDTEHPVVPEAVMRGA